MAIDPTIPLQVRGINIKPLSESLGQAMQLRGMQQEHEARQVAIDHQRALTKQEAALQQVFASGQATPEAIYRVVGPMRGAEILKGISALEELRNRKITDARDTAGRLAMGLRALPEGNRALAWPGVREAAIAGGLGDAETIPEELSTEYLGSIIAWATGKEEQPARVTFTKPEKYTVNGKRIFATMGSDGVLYDLMRRPIPADQIEANDSDVLSGGDSDYTRYLVRSARDRGKTVDQLTAREEEELRTKFYATARAPVGGSGSGGGSSRSARPAAGSKDDPKFPRGVEDYILAIRNRGTTQAEALAEVLAPATWAKLRADHPSLSSQRVREAIGQLIPEEGAMVSPGASAGAGAPAGASAPAAGQKTMTADELRYSAQRLGVSEAEARALAERSGYVIR